MNFFSAFFSVFLGWPILILIGVFFIANLNLALSEKKLKDKYKKLIQDMLNENKQTFPYMAQQFSDLIYMYDEELANLLRTKKHPAIKAASEVSRMSAEKREIIKQQKMLEYQLNYYELLFPWLEEFKKIPPKNGYRYTTTVAENNSEYERLKDWLSPEEYNKLPSMKKYQLALDRYKKRTKNDWEAGIEYERYIGYKYDCQGYKVIYQGALQGLNDMGRDLLAYNTQQTLVIQCKRWSQTKSIHEKHIFQLYGSTVMLTVENPGIKYIPIFVTTTKLSDVANKCATFLGVEVRNIPFSNDYPMIKCNISKAKEKIYHLPFDQQYDKIVIDRSRGEFYAKTVEEAEKAGFRRAFHWSGNKE